MKIKLFSKLLGITLLAYIVGCSSIPVQKKYEFDDEIFLRNDSIKIGISPKTGRITYFGRIEEKNLLWINSQDGVANNKHPNWTNYGGDKVWPAQQHSWHFIIGHKGPYRQLEGLPWTLLKKDAESVEIETYVDCLKIKMKRKIKIHPSKPEVKIITEISRTAPSSHAVQIWSITQLDDCKKFLLFSEEKNMNGRSFIDLGRYGIPENILKIDKKQILLDISDYEGKGIKIGAFGSFIGAIYEDHIFLQHSKYIPGEYYPDSSSVQVYCEKNYSEIETLSPAKHLKTGESIKHTVTWKLLKRDKNSPLEDLLK